MKRILADQAARPRGLLGRFVGRVMAKSNLESNKWVISLLDVEDDDHVLEIGFGPGTAIRDVTALTPRGRVAGIDISQAMVDQATNLNQKSIGEGRVDLRVGEATSIPWSADSFDKAFAVNVIYLWLELGPVLTEIKRILNPGGVIGLYLAPIEMMERLGFTEVDSFTFHTPEEVKQACRDAGYSRLDEKSAPIGEGTGVCILAWK